MDSSKSDSGTNGRRINPGVFTCQTCSALFTCLQYYQQHRTHHAESSGVKLLCCKHCAYSTENNFHYNWHIMSHNGEEEHSCQVCRQPDVPSTNHVKVENEEDEPPSCSMAGKRSVATATTDDLLLLGSATTPRRYSSETDEANQNHYVPYSPDHHHQQQQDDDSQRHLYGHGSDEDQEDLNGENGQMMNQGDEISDEEDDEEEEIESEDEGMVGQDYLNMATEVKSIGMGTMTFDDGLNQGPPYTKSENASPGEVPMTPVNQRGRGKGNRKSRIISQESDGDGSGGVEGFRRKFHCSHCGKSFKTKSHLQRHILTHTGEKPYHCNRCGSKFNQSSSLRNHLIAIHTKQYPHYCTTCNKGFLMPALLQKHLATSHRNNNGT